MPSRSLGWCARGIVASIAAFGWLTPALAQESRPAGPGLPWFGEAGITETVSQITERQRHAAESPATRVPRSYRRDPLRVAANPRAPLIPMWPFRPGSQSPVGAQTWNLLGGGATDNPQTIGVNVASITLADAAGFVPPDSQGAAGPTQLVVIANGWVRTLGKATGAADGVLNVGTDAFFASVRNGATAVNPQARFDRLSNRWFILMMNIGVPNRIMIAVSSGPVITGASGFTFYFFSQDAPPPVAPGMADFPSLGVDANALYIGTNRIGAGGALAGTDGFVVRKSSVLSGGPIVVTAFRNLASATGPGPFAPRGVDNPDPAPTNGFFIGVNHTSFGVLQMRRVSNPGAVPAISANFAIPVPATTLPRTVVALGTSGSLDALDDRLSAAMIRRNRATGLDGLWVAHNVEVDSLGVATNGGGRNGSRWYEIGALTGAPTLAQAGTLFDPSTFAISHWIPSIAATGQGHMAIGCSAAGSALQPGARTAGRLASDPPGTIQAPLGIVGGANYNVQAGGVQRWGDYSGIAVDPVDDQSMWMFQEYCNANNSWAVRATRLVAPPPCVPTASNPAILNQGDTANVTVTGASIGGAAFYDTDATYVGRLAAAVSGDGVTVNSVSFNPTTPTQLIMNVTVSGGATLGARTVSATNPDGQFATSAAGILTISAGSLCPWFSQQAEPVAMCEGSGSATFTVAAEGTPPPTLQWRRDQVNIPGATEQSLVISHVTASDAGTYDCIATNACGSEASDPAALTVNTGPSFSLSPASQSVLVRSMVTLSVQVGGVPVPALQWRKNQANIPGATGPQYTIGSVVLADAGRYECIATNTCGSIASAPAILDVSCYANCDGSTVAPILNANDFACFINRFAAGEGGANCDGSTVPPTLNANDFQCFMNEFSFGCP